MRSLLTSNGFVLDCGCFVRAQTCVRFVPLNNKPLQYQPNTEWLFSPGPLHPFHLFPPKKTSAFHQGQETNSHKANRVQGRFLDIHNRHQAPLWPLAGGPSTSICEATGAGGRIPRLGFRKVGRCWYIVSSRSQKVNLFFQLPERST